VTTEHSDWATNCPEYKVTAVQVGLLHPVSRMDAAHAGVDESVSVLVD
jgi:formate dehydrogenase major subunit